MPVQPIPEGYHSVTPYLIVHDGSAAIDYYCKALGATQIMCMPGPGGKVMHAEVQIGDCRIMLADEFPEMNARSPKHYGGSPVGICLYVEDVDALFAQAVEAGGKVVRPVQDQFYGDRSGTLEDPFGHQWTIATHKEDLTPQQIQERMAAMSQQQGAPA